ncbi:hypothetical protein SETIT_2G276400v2 [Setaria italica]|uniref:UDP-glycosyltransferases domain-containing protein n=1 Tax=Setaria italica TaxID=4555 RepID=A0A368Q3N5_SETIT|nr:hypothetical protein SETIT_2G276400v2 [Setaria italica]
MAEPDSEHRIHVLLPPNPSQGHINPILQFGKRLAAHRGARCTLAVTRFVLGQSGGGGQQEPATGGGGAVHAWAGLVEAPLVGDEKPLELPGLLAGLRLRDLPTFLTDPDDRAYLNLLVNQFAGLDTADHVLVNSFYELQPQESEYMVSAWRAKTVGPTVPSAYLDNRLPDDTSYGFHLYTPLTATTRAWLDARPVRSVVYVSFGSLAKPDRVQMAEMAEGLYNSGKAFLWVVRASEISKVPENLADKAKERGLIVTWNPQLEVSAHPAVGCFVTHCGWNSAMEGMGAGVPMLAMPQWSDQTMNAKYIEDVWQVGVRVRPDERGVVRKEEVERCVREVGRGAWSACKTLPIGRRRPCAKVAAPTRTS